MIELIGDRIRKQRKKMGMTQGQLGMAVRVSKAAICQWEANENKTFDEAKFDLLIKALDTSKEYLKTGLYREDARHDLTVNEGNPTYFVELKTSKEKELIELFRNMADFHRDELIAEAKEKSLVFMKIKEQINKTNQGD